MRTFLYFLISLFFTSSLYSQSDIPLQTWKSHLSYRDGLWLTQSDKKIIYASRLGLIILDKDDLSVNFLSKENGMTSVKVSQVFYDNFNDQLIVVYDDSSFDIIKDDEVINIPFIRENATILGSKKINFIEIADETNAYLATDFGVVGFNLRKLEFTFTTITDLKVNAVSFINGILYAGTEEGLYQVRVEGTNVTDFGVWSQIPNNAGLPQSYEVRFMTSYRDKLFIVTDNDLYYSEGGSAFIKLYSTIDKFQIRFISSEGQSLLVGMENDVFISKILIIDQNLQIQEGGAACINRVIYGLEDSKGRIWYADQWSGIRYTDSYNSGCHRLEFNSPWNNTAGQVAFDNKKVFFASGGINEDYGYANSVSGFYIFEEGIWSNFNGTNVPFMDQQQIFNVQAIASHPTQDDIYIGSYWNGIMKFNPVTKSAELFNKDNSILQGAEGDPNRTRISYMVFDDKQNLWIVNYLSPRPLVVKTKEGQWYSFSLPSPGTLGNLAIDPSGNKWASIVGTGGGVLVYNESGSISDPTDDKKRYITRSNSEISGNRVNCIAVDLDGSVWVGTSNGPVIFECGDPFSESCRGNTRRVVVDGIPAALLRDEDVLAIAIDGANRKWFGTRNGIFVQSPDGMSEELRFDVKNSPLLDNIIRNLSFNPVTGEMFIITDIGIQSFRTTTTGGGRTHANQVFAYPNPVRPQYTGLIAIKGLVRDANVKITDINGKLVYETQALGGQAVWDGRDYNGVRAATGVYLVFSANENISFGNETHVTKILFIN